MKTVFITGASSGIGKALAKQFAMHQYNLILTARNKEVLLRLKRQLEGRYAVQVVLITADLSQKKEINRLCRELEELEMTVDVAVNNAGMGLSGAFSEQDDNRIANMIKLNVQALTILTKFFLKKMEDQGKGTIINLASTGSYHPGPYTAVYYATKAYVLSFTEAVAEEIKRQNIKMIAACPGAVKTNFAKNAGRKDNQFADKPEKVAEQIYKKAIVEGKKIIFTDLKYRLWVKLPRKIAAFLIGTQQKRLLDHNKKRKIRGVLGGKE